MKKKEIWLISERGEAKDNGYIFFQYMKQKHPEVKTYFVIDKKNKQDYKKVKKYGNLVQYKSIRHKLLYLFADKTISSHTKFCEPWDYIKIQRFKKNHPFFWKQKKDIFLQHGIIKDDIKQFYGKSQFPIDLFICGAKREYEYVKENFGHPDHVVQYTGLARFDRLHNIKEKKQILLMPTWRINLDFDGYASKQKKIQRFLKSTYFRQYQLLLNNKKLINILKQYGYRLLFYPHANMQPYLSYFNKNSENIILASSKKYDIQNLLRESKLLITDYSSVAMDMAYMEKPIIYYQFDSEEFHKFHYKNGYFNYEKDGFGKVVKNEDEVIEELLYYFKNNFKNKEQYLERSKSFFTLKDRKNCSRIFNQIKVL